MPPAAETASTEAAEAPGPGQHRVVVRFPAAVVTNVENMGESGHRSYACTVGPEKAEVANVPPLPWAVTIVRPERALVDEPRGEGQVILNASKLHLIANRVSRDFYTWWRWAADRECDPVAGRLWTYDNVIIQDGDTASGESLWQPKVGDPFPTHDVDCLGEPFVCLDDQPVASRYTLRFVGGQIVQHFRGFQRVPADLAGPEHPHGAAGA